MGDQELQHPEIREPVPHPREQHLDKPPKEQVLRQTRLAEFLPGGSPVVLGLRQSEALLEEDDETFAGNDDQQAGHKGDDQVVKEDVVEVMIGARCDDDNGEPSNIKKNIATVMPSSDVRLKQPAVTKPRERDIIVGDTEKLKMDLGNTSMAGQNEKECIFKRGGMCTTHGCKGEKFSVTETKWCAKGDGTYGYKSSKKTKYRCRLRGVVKSNGSNPGYGTEKQTVSSEREGHNILSSGATQGISREGFTGLDANESESFEDRLCDRIKR